MRTPWDAYRDIDRLTETTSKLKDNTDKDILYNAGFSLGVGLVLLTIFIILRSRLPRLYSGNLVGAQKPRLPRRSGVFGWLHTTFTASDSQLLSFAGFDAFLQVQTIKLMLGMLVAVSVPTLLVLLPVYHFASSDVELGSYYMRLSIIHCAKEFLWFPFVVCYATSLLIFYFSYLFYRNYAIVRQAYLKDPSALTSCLLLQWLIGITGSAKEARRVASLHNRSIILDGISEKYDKDRLHSVLSELGTAGAATSITFINPRDELVAAVEKRNKSLRCFEEDCMAFLKAAVKEHCASNSIISEKDYLKELSEQAVTERERRLFLVVEQLTNPLFYPNFRPKTQPKDGEQVDALYLHFDELKKSDMELDECIEEYMHGYLPDDQTQDIPSTATSTSGKVQKAFIQQSTLISFQKFTWISHNLKDLKLTLYGTSQSAVVIMESAKGASSMSQTVLSRRPFSLSAKMAPAADDVLWDNMQLSPSDRSLRHTAGEIMFILANLFFIPVVSVVSSLTQLDQLIKTFPKLGDIIPENKTLRSTLQGILAPLAVNTAFAIAPYIFYYISFYQGKTSKTALQLSLVRKFSWFLFFQSFIVIIIAASLVDVVNDLIAGKWDKLLGSMRETFPLKSSLFFNMLLQKAFMTMPVTILKIGPLSKLLLHAVLPLGSLPRNKVEQSVPDEFLYGQDYPMHMVSLLQITLAFMTITPVSVIAGIIYFSVAYIAFRLMTLFNFRTKHESGGTVWPRVCDQIMVGCLLNQAFILLHFTVRGAALQAVFLCPLIFGTLAFSRFLRSTFTCRIEYLPQTNEDEQIVNKLIDDLLNEQGAMLRTGENGEDIESEGDKEADFIPVKEVVYGIQQQRNGQEGSGEFGVSAQDLSNPYTNPVLFKRYSSLVLHPALLPLLSKLSTMEDTKIKVIMKSD